MAAALAACGGGGGGTPPVQNPPPTTAPTTGPTTAPTNTPTTAPSSTPVPVSASAVIAVDGANALGKDNWQTNGVTDTNPADPGDGDTANGGLGPNAVGPISCAIGAESNVSSTVYHVHAFLGILVNGVEMAIPDAIGMQGPAEDPSSGTVQSFTCAYNLHTHAASGIIHVEDPAISGNWNTGVNPPAKYNLQALMDVWGQSLSGLAGGPGMPQIYVGTVTGKSPISGHTTEDYVDAYSLSTAAPTSILLQHHVAIWLVYGTFPSAGLPPVDFGVSN